MQNLDMPKPHFHSPYSQTGMVLHILKTEGHITNSRMLSLGIARYGDRIFTLRNEGHDIVTNHIKDGLYDYIYRGEFK